MSRRLCRRACAFALRQAGADLDRSERAELNSLRAINADGADAMQWNVFGGFPYFLCDLVFVSLLQSFGLAQGGDERR
jgi:hypothetical protein